MDRHKDTVSAENHQTQGIELLALYRITELIGTAVDLSSTLSSILGVLSSTMKMERATLLLFDQRTQKLTIKASCGLLIGYEISF